MKAKELRSAFLLSGFEEYKCDGIQPENTFMIIDNTFYFCRKNEEVIRHVIKALNCEVLEVLGGVWESPRAFVGVRIRIFSHWIKVVTSD